MPLLPPISNSDSHRAIGVKVCGITTEQDLELCATLGIDAIGLLIVREPGATPRPPTHRLTPEQARNLATRVPSSMDAVLLIHTPTVTEAVALADFIRPAILQIPADVTSLGFVQKIKAALAFPVSIIKSVPVPPNASLQEIMAEAQRWSRSGAIDAILLDSRRSSAHAPTGGTGKTHDWQISRQVVQALPGFPVILAGGLNPQNVGAAIATVQPCAVDVMTGLENAAGVKNPDKVRDFLRAVREGAVR